MLCPDQNCALLPPYRKDITLARGIIDKLIGALVTRFGGTVPATRRALEAASIDEWGKMKITNDGDLIRSAQFQREAEDRRDATYVRVSLYLFSINIRAKY